MSSGYMQDWQVKYQYLMHSSSSLCNVIYLKLVQINLIFSVNVASIPCRVPASRVSKRNFARRNKTALGLRGTAETLLKIDILRSNKTTIYVVQCNDGLPGCNVNVSDNQQPEFKSLIEFYILIFLIKLKIVENTNKEMKKNQN